MRLRFWKKEKKQKGVYIPKHYTDLIVPKQCFGKLKSGARCSRVVNATYCWQHKIK